jgi:NADP-dependent 3-hydroxy acid dehydrogenase YdfG
MFLAVNLEGENKMGRLANKIAVITGATSGIGEAVALMYVKEGAKVVLVGRNADKGKQLVEEIQHQAVKHFS